MTSQTDFLQDANADFPATRAEALARLEAFEKKASR